MKRMKEEVWEIIRRFGAWYVFEHLTSKRIHFIAEEKGLVLNEEELEQLIKELEEEGKVRTIPLNEGKKSYLLQEEVHIRALRRKAEVSQE